MVEKGGCGVDWEGWGVSPTYYERKCLTSSPPDALPPTQNKTPKNQNVLSNLNINIDININITAGHLLVLIFYYVLFY